MITYRLVSRHTLREQQQKEFHVSPQDGNFKETVFKRHLTKNRFKVGDVVKQKGTSNKGTIFRIEEDIDKVLWHVNSPKYIFVKLDSGKVDVFAWNELTQKGCK